MTQTPIDWRASYRAPATITDKDCGRSRYIFDSELGLIEITEKSNHQGPEKLMAPKGCIRDIEGYRAVASDVASDNKRPWIGSRSRHREFLRDNAYVEIGNEVPLAPRNGPSERDRQAERVADIKRALGE